MVTYRLRTFTQFDRFMVMGDDELLGFGKPAELFEKQGAFYDLVKNSQDKDFLVGNITSGNPT